MHWWVYSEVWDCGPIFSCLVSLLKNFGVIVAIINCIGMALLRFTKFVLNKGSSASYL